MSEPVTSTNAARQSTSTGDPRDARDRAEAAKHRELVNARLRPCPDCGGLGGAHAPIHSRYGNGGGGNKPCPRDMDESLPLHRTEAGWPNCSTCDGGGCLDCTDPA